MYVIKLSFYARAQHFIEKNTLPWTNVEHNLAQHNHKDKIQSYEVLNIFPSRIWAKKVAAVKLLFFVPKDHMNFIKS